MSILFTLFTVIMFFMWCAYYSCCKQEYWKNNFGKKITELKLNRFFMFICVLFSILYMNYIFVPLFGIYVSLNGILRECEENK